jgi:hypothetical protein
MCILDSLIALLTEKAQGEVQVFRRDKPTDHDFILQGHKFGTNMHRQVDGNKNTHILSLILHAAAYGHSPDQLLTHRRRPFAVLRSNTSLQKAVPCRQSHIEPRHNRVGIQTSKIQRTDPEEDARPFPHLFQPPDNLFEHFQIAALSGSYANDVGHLRRNGRGEFMGVSPGI